ncbi:HEPN domain-containing protein [Azospirillum sp. TSH100]|uniref:HEPN domain-containing protein n=1 Tax=Azospirillum sp. TSH100 TaxID=652764 RepID=UPI001304E68F|nr:HEPN domain-containing protein [Azospirillum sp. TSH100]
MTLAEEEAGAAEQLIEAFPRQAAYQLQQSVEKVARAILAYENIAFGTSHNLGQMAAALTVDHPWRDALMEFDRLSPAATRNRYPAPGGRIPLPPSVDELRKDLMEIRILIGRAHDLTA